MVFHVLVKQQSHLIYRTCMHPHFPLLTCWVSRESLRAHGGGDEGERDQANINCNAGIEITSTATAKRAKNTKVKERKKMETVVITIVC